MHLKALPTVVVTRTVGSGKTSVADEIEVLLHEQSLAQARREPEERGQWLQWKAI